MSDSIGCRGGCPKYRCYCAEPGCDASYAPPARRGDWIQTFTGRQYWPLDPRADEVELEDIAHHLSMLCRYTGACTRFYSVAEHSLHVAAVVARAGGDTLAGLMHDAAEAYCNDIARPVKRAITGYTAIEAANLRAISARFGLDAEAMESPLIKQADSAMLLAEMETITTAGPGLDKARGYFTDVPDEMLRTARERMRLANDALWPVDRVKLAFITRYAELTQ